MIFSHVERMEKDRITKRFCVGECVSSRSVGRLEKRRINTVNDGLKKRGLDFQCQARKENGA